MQQYPSIIKKAKSENDLSDKYPSMYTKKSDNKVGRQVESNKSKRSDRSHGNQNQTYPKGQHGAEDAPAAARDQRMANPRGHQPPVQL